MRLLHRLTAIRHHHHLLGKAAYIAAVTGLVGGTVGQLVSDFKETGGDWDPALFVIVSMVCASLAVVAKHILKSGLVEDDNIIQLGIYKQDTLEAWKLTGTRKVILIAAALFFVGTKLILGDLSLLGHLSTSIESTDSIVKSTAIAACQIGTNVSSGSVTDRTATLKEIGRLRQRLVSAANSPPADQDFAEDQDVMVRTFHILNISEAILSYSGDESLQRQLLTALLPCYIGRQD